jgi:SSS family solute:Na+ symporter
VSGLGETIALVVPFCLFLAALLVLGVTNLMAARTLDDFLIAGRKTGGWGVGGSLAATVIGGSSTLGLAGLVFARGLSGSWWLLVGVAGLGALLFFLRRVCSAPAYTLPEVLGRWYGQGVRRIAAALILLAWLGIIGAQTRAAGSILSTFLGGPPWLWSVAAGFVFVFYTVSGGQLSVIRTDALQITLILGGTVAAAVGGLSRAGGLHALAGKLPPGHLAFPVSAGFSWLDLGVLLLVVGSTYLIGPDMLSRIFSSRGVASARRGISLAIGVLLPYTILITLVGLEARALFPSGPAESAYPLLAHGILPPLAASITAVGLLAAFLSSADTTLLTAAAVFAMDLAGTPRLRTLGSLRATTALVGAAAVGVGLASGGIIPSLLLGYSIFSTGLFVPVLAGLAGRPLGHRAAAVAALGGGAIGLAGKLAGSDPLVAGGFLFTAVVWTVDRWALRGRPRPPLTGGGNPR